MTEVEVARYARCSRQHIAMQRRRGVLPYVEFGRRFLYPTAEIERILQPRLANPPAGRTSARST